MTFFVIHAVSGKELASTPEMCEPARGERAWTNPKDEAVDVFVTVKSNVYREIKIEGRYVIDRP